MSYSAIVLDEASKSKLLAALKDQIPVEWEVIAHHMTLCMGGLFGSKNNTKDFSHLRGKKASFDIIKVGKSNRAMAVIVDTSAFFCTPAIEHFKSLPKAPKFFHITVAIDRKNGAKPVDSNFITEFTDISPIELSGEIQEVC